MADSRVIEVVAGIIRDAGGRILLARRTEGRDLAGLWEFPGGKREPDESPEAALIRELHEELGIDVEIGAALINVPQTYPDKRLQLDVRMIDHWRGAVRGREGQALAWAPPHMLAGYAMPPADRPVVAALQQPDRYLVTPEPGEDETGWLASLQRALAAGIRRVQLRAPTADPSRWCVLAAHAVAACRAAGAEVLVNADIELARRLAVGVHLRAAQLATLQQRPLPTTLPVAASCHDVAELRAAQALGCDFALVGSIKPTASHPGAGALGWRGFSALREVVSLPLYAIGGLGIDDIAQARRHGAQGIAAIRGLWPAPPHGGQPAHPSGMARAPARGWPAPTARGWPAPRTGDGPHPARGMARTPRPGMARALGAGMAHTPGAGMAHTPVGAPPGRDRSCL